MAKFTIETDDKNEATLMLNANRMASVLYELLNWQRALYRGKDYNDKILYNGQLYTHNEFIEKNAGIVINDKERLYKDSVTSVYLREDIERKLNSILPEIRDLIEENYV